MTSLFVIIRQREKSRKYFGVRLTISLELKESMFIIWDKLTILVRFFD